MATISIAPLLLLRLLLLLLLLLVLGRSATACVRVLLGKILVGVLRRAAQTNGHVRATDGGASGHASGHAAGHAGQTHLRAHRARLTPTSLQAVSRP